MAHSVSFFNLAARCRLCIIGAGSFGPHRRGRTVKLFNPVPALLVVGLIAAAGQAFAGERSDDDHHGAVLEIAATREWGLQDGKPSFGPSIAIEVTPIEHWLEIEAGISPLRSKDGTEWEADLVFKKPFQLSKNVEFMIGAGPQWSSTNSLGAVAVLDFMFWVTPQYGWFVEPSYSYAFSRGHDQNLAVNVGLLIALPSR